MEHVAILGASNNESRYSYKAQVKLIEQGHTVYPISIKDDTILGIPAYRSIKDIDHAIDTVTVYINPNHLHQAVSDILTLDPKRVIFNPGSESSEEMVRLGKAGITIQEACTLVLLATDQFEEN